MTSNIVYIGLKGHVAAIDKNDGRTLWQTKLKRATMHGDRFVSLLVDNRRVFAHTYGELFCLDAETGRILWQNPLEGLSYDIASIAVQGMSTATPPVQYNRRQAAAASSASSGSAGGD